MAVEFTGLPPHDLGIAELATAQFADGNVEVTLYVLDQWHRPNAAVVRVQMTPAVARALAEHLTGAVAAAGAPR